MTDPLYNKPPVRLGGDWPKTALTFNEQTLARLRVKLDTQVAKKITPQTGWRARVAFAKNFLSEAAREYIPRAEKFLALPGEEKKRLVVKELLEVLKMLELRVDILPGWLEPMAWWTLERQLPKIVQRAFDSLDAIGTVNP